MATIAIGLTDIKLKLNNVEVGSVFASSTSIGEVMEGSSTITQETPTETKIKGDYGDATLFSLNLAGDLSLETDIIDVDPKKIAALTGATYTEGTGTVALPSSAPILHGEVIMEFDNGIDKLKFAKAQIICNLAWGNVKTEPFKVHLKAVALASDTRYVDIIMPV